MRRALVLLATLTLASLNACGPEKHAMQVQGTVTAADDASPIAGASVEFVYFEPTGIIFGPSIRHTVDRSTTDAQGRYSLSYVHEGHCSATFFELVANAQGFAEEVIWSGNDLFITCRKELQTIDIQLEREST